MPTVARSAGPRRTALVVAGLAASLLAGCGGAVDRDAVASALPSGSARCAAAVDATLRRVATRVYDQAARGSEVRSAEHRLGASRALADAVARGDAAATRAALKPLLAGQIRRIEVRRGGRVLARFGHAPALAPAAGVLRDAGGRPVGSYVLAVGDRAAIVGLLQELSAAQVTVRQGSAPVAGAAMSVPVTAFPRGRMMLALTGVQPARGTCASTAAGTGAATLRAIAHRLLAGETSGAQAVRVLRHVAGDPRFVAAVAHDDPVALRASIIRFFRTHSLHVVRIRATTADGRLVGDVGGPFVLAPASGTVREPDRHVVGTVTLSVQDDTGYIKLMHRFTGLGVVLRTPAGVVPGSAHVPASSRARSIGTFTTTAFPTGPLQVTLYQGA